MTNFFDYFFDDYKNGDEPYRYYYNYEDARDYIISNHRAKDIITDYVDEGLYTSENNWFKNNLKKEFKGFNGTYRAITNMKGEDAEKLARRLIEDSLFIYERELKEYFRDIAHYNVLHSA